MAQPIHIVVGSVMGTAVDTAQSAAAVLSGLGHPVRTSVGFSGGPLYQTPDEVVLICTSNTGMGDLPENIAPLYAHLTVDCPDIYNRLYGIINLGDSSYPNFAQAGQTLDEAMADIGARRVGDTLVLDDILVDDHEEEAAQWAQTWAAQLAENQS